MSKDGMKSYSLEGFKKEFESDATKRADTQAETIKGLIAENKKLESALRTMCRRCKATSSFGVFTCAVCTGDTKEMCIKLLAADKK